VEVCDDGAFAFGDGDVFISGTFDDGEGDGFLRHCRPGKYTSNLRESGTKTY
jgi:hypothetical protein